MKRNLVATLLAAILLATLAYLYLRPLPLLQPVLQTPAPPQTATIAMPWPAQGQGAIGASGYGILDSHNISTPVPIGSIAKIITALAVVQQKPLALNSQGPSLILDATDVGYFNYYYANDGSVAPVVSGESLSEYQALQAMLLPSANNIADSLARWAFGSPQAYITYANNMLKTMGLSKTTIGDTNGFSDTSTSTAVELVKIGLKAMQQPVIAQIVSQTTAQIPQAGIVKNVNWLLGTDGVVGIKTGNTDKAGGCYLFAAQHQIHGQNVTLVGAILGAPDLAGAISSARPLLQTVDGGFLLIIPVKKGQQIATVRAPWGSASKIVAAKDIPLLVWSGRDIKLLSEPSLIKPPDAAGTPVGQITVQSGGLSNSSPLILTNQLPSPAWHWRLLH